MQQGGSHPVFTSQMPVMVGLGRSGLSWELRLNPALPSWLQQLSSCSHHHCLPASTAPGVEPRCSSVGCRCLNQCLNCQTRPLLLKSHFQQARNLDLGWERSEDDKLKQDSFLTPLTCIMPQLCVFYIRQFRCDRPSASLGELPHETPLASGTALVWPCTG